jgi:hypothetical protein
MDNSKFILKSRAFWGAAGPAMGMAVQQFGLPEQVPQEANNFVSGLMAVLGAVAYFAHLFKPDGKVARVLPRNAGQAKALLPFLLLASVAAMPPYTIGCASMNAGAGFNVDDCAKLDVATFAESYVCTAVVSSTDPTEAERNAAICHHSMLAAYHTSKAICIGLAPESETP